MAGRVSVDGSVFGKPVSGLTTTSGTVVSLTVVSTIELSVVLDEPPHALINKRDPTHKETDTIDLLEHKRFFMFRSL
jgi:hypothetical protein